MENRAGWHHKLPSKEQLEQAFAELDKQMEEIENGR
jgi:transketolase